MLNEETEFEEAFKVGATGVMTDYPTKLTRFLQNNERCLLDEFSPISKWSEGMHFVAYSVHNVTAGMVPGDWMWLFFWGCTCNNVIVFISLRVTRKYKDTFNSFLPWQIRTVARFVSSSRSNHFAISHPNGPSIWCTAVEDGQNVEEINWNELYLWHLERYWNSSVEQKTHFTN